MRQSLFSGNQRHLARLDLRDASANLRHLRLGDVSGNIVRKALHNAIGEFGAFNSRKLLRLFEDLG